MIKFKKGDVIYVKDEEEYNSLKSELLKQKYNCDLPYNRGSGEILQYVFINEGGTTSYSVIKDNWTPNIIYSEISIENQLEKVRKFIYSD